MPIDRNALRLSNISGGAKKQSTVTVTGGTPTSPTISGTASSVVIVNGKEVFNQSVTF